jgi:hypothetical protein
MSARLPVAAAALAAAVGLFHAHRGLPALVSSPPLIDGDRIFEAAAPLVRDRRVVGFTTDRGLPEAQAWLFAAQFALTPAAVHAETDNLETLRRLRDGYAVVAAFEDLGRRERLVADLRDWAKRENVRLDIVILPGGIAVVRSYPS